jgi:hypothetical protein
MFASVPFACDRSRLVSRGADAVAPAAIGPDTGYVVNTTRHAFAAHQIPDLRVLGKHTQAVARWSAVHCLGA